MLAALLVLPVSLLTPLEPPRQQLCRRQVTAAAAAALVLAPRQRASADQVVKKFGTTEGGVKYFDIEEGKCALFNVACSPQKGGELSHLESSSRAPRSPCRAPSTADGGQLVDLLVPAADLVKIKYKAYLSNGKIFDSSEGPGRKPLSAKYKTGALLPGWEEGMETMKEGGTRVMQVGELRSSVREHTSSPCAASG